MTDPVVIVDYDPEWPRIFEDLKTRAVEALGPVALSVEHVGSTAGCAAKPIIDQDIVVRSDADVPAAIVRLARVGYVHRGDFGVAGREAFRHPVGEPRHHLYVVVFGNDAYLRHVRLRDRLRNNPAEARAYGELKRALAARYADDREGYTEAKSDFITRVLTDEGA